MKTNKSNLDRFEGCLLGLAVGDALCTTNEFRPRGSFHPVKDIVGGGPFNLNPGEWTDDTSMALCFANSLIEVGGFDAKDQMDRYIRWRDTGYMSSNGVCFDIGNTIRRALYDYERTGDPYSGPTDPRSAGNGSIMRLAPVVMFYYPDRRLVLKYCAESSKTTHGATECLDACILLGDILFRALDDTTKNEVLFNSDINLFESESIKSIASGNYRGKDEPLIKGTGYVVESLEAALWCFWATDSFDQAVIKAANLGDDADTTAAVCGQLAGAFYGQSDIPGHWLKKLVMRKEISSVAKKLYHARTEV
jgi:ADP-ribosyl-[dinitrogen reductase] hydrolase